MTIYFDRDKHIVYPDHFISLIIIFLWNWMWQGNITRTLVVVVVVTEKRECMRLLPDFVDENDERGRSDYS